MTKRLGLGLVLLLLAGCTHSAAAPRTRPVAEAKPVAAGLQAFGDCDALLSALRTEAVKEVTPFGLPVQADPAYGRWTSDAVTPTMAYRAAKGSLLTAASTMAVHSGTTLQEADVDEPDTVKTDGRIMAVSARGGFLEVLDVSHAKPVRLGRLQLHMTDPQLLLDGHTLLALGTREVNRRLGAVVETVDLSDPTTPTAVRRFRLDGVLLDARVVHGRVLVAVRSTPHFAFRSPGHGTTVSAALAYNRRLVQQATAQELLPSVSVTPGGATYPAGCSSALQPKLARGLERTSLITLDPDKDAPTQHVTVVGSSAQLYASSDALYLATSRYAVGGLAGSWRGGGDATTDLHGFDVTRPDHLRYLGTGSVDGQLLDSYAMSESHGYLRVATTTFRDTTITVLRPRDGVLAEVAHVGGLGVGQQLTGVRFLGDTAYVTTTLRMSDPLHVVDLSDPTRPVARGELAFPGSAGALYDLGGHKLLGIGTTSGATAFVFDTSDSAHPKLVSKAVLPGAWSAAAQEHHALLWWPSTRNIAFPVTTGAAVLKVSPRGDVAQQGVLPVKAGVDRMVVVGDRLYAVSSAGVTATLLSSLDGTSWTPFP